MLPAGLAVTRWPPQTAPPPGLATPPEVAPPPAHLTPPPAHAPRPLPQWFGPPGRPRFGWLHLPGSGTARLGVVLCPAVGLEASVSYRAQLLLARRLQAADVACLRFDYDGTGDSAGRGDDPGRVGSWLDSVVDAVGVLRQLGCPRLVLVGMRLGATLAAVAAQRCEVSGLVLWDPCISGRAFLREQGALAAVGVGGDGRDGATVEIPGFVLSAETVTAMERLEIPEGSGARRTLVLVRPDRPGRRRLERRLTGPGVEWDQAKGQRELLDVEFFPKSRMPHATIDRIVSWVGSGAAGVADARLGRPIMRESVTLTTAGAGAAVTERMEALGGLGLAAWVTERAGGPTGPTVLMLNTNVDPHHGPGRLWVEMGRDWASSGLRVVRFDLSGVADSPVRAGQHENVLHAPEWLEDVEVAASAVSPGDPSDVVLVGLCTGGYLALEAGLKLLPRGVCAINPVFKFLPAEALDGGGPSGARRLCRLERVPRWLNADDRHAETIPAQAGRRVRGWAKPYLPEAGWWLYNRWPGRLAPMAAMRLLTAGGVDTLVACAEPDAKLIARGASAEVRRLREEGRFRFEVIEGLDHALLRVTQRSQVERLLTDHVVGRVAAARAGWRGP